MHEILSVWSRKSRKIITFGGFVSCYSSSRHVLAREKLFPSKRSFYDPFNSALTEQLQLLVIKLKA
jgi:hypothetical protein